MNRWQPLRDKTFCYSRFKTNEVAINDFFWHTEGILCDASIRSARASASDYLKTIFDYGQDLGNRSDTLIKDFTSLLPQVSNTFHLFALVACASYFELYMSQSFRLALYSNVGVLFGQPKTLDGVKVLKAGEMFPFQATLKSLIEGKWKDRRKIISKVFRTELVAIDNNISALDDLRIMRNSVAHQFGLEGDMRFLEKIDPSYFQKSSMSISEGYIKASLKIIRQVVDELEEKIASPNIGCFEYLLFIHNYKNNIDNFRQKMPAAYANFSLEKMLNAFSTENGLQRITRAEARSLISFYNQS